MTTPTPAAGPARFRLWQRLLVLLLLTVAAGVGLAGPAAAHNVLIRSDPTDGSPLQKAPPRCAVAVRPAGAGFRTGGDNHRAGRPTVRVWLAADRQHRGDNALGDA